MEENITIEDQNPSEPISNPERKRGKLKIFLGYCAGVGKTYRMLQEALANKEHKVDVAIGLIETHGRKETEVLSRTLEVIPRKKIDYSGLTITEMDLDTIIARHPQLVLVDELAHTNLPQARHSKRYQDVEEILNHGIDVFSTLNIQHIQSLTDIVQQITNVKIEETIPDRIMELAVEIELVDLSPEKLQQRLAEGKVYIPQKAKQAMQKFFKRGNLLALRELSLKYTAKRVDIDLLSYREQEDISNVWPIESKILVGIGSGKITEKLLLIAHRMATDLEAEWFAVHVESPQQVRLSERARNQLHRNIHLAEELGAKVVSLTGNVIADEIVRFAKQKNVTLIIAGLSQRSRLEEFFKGSILTRLVKKSSPINVLAVGDDSHVDKRSAQPHTGKTIKYKKHLVAGLSIALTTLICWLLSPWLTPFNILMLMFLSTIATGILWGSTVGITASLLAIAAVDFFFIPPIYSFAISDLRYLSDFAVFIFVTFFISMLGRFIRWRAASARYRERFLSALYSFSHEMMIAESMEDILSRAVKNISEAFDSDVIMLLPDLAGQLELAHKNKPTLLLNETEKAVAIWVYKNGRPAGRSTTTLSSAKWYYVPLQAQDNTLGVVCVMKLDIEKNFTQEQKRLLESFASVVALAIAKATNK